ncbi:ribosomal L27 protein-domain-containing protein, partial [Entophlyctis helioformis]
ALGVATSSFGRSAVGAAWTAAAGATASAAAAATTAGAAGAFTATTLGSGSSVFAQLTQVRWATKKSGGSTTNTRTSRPKYLGFKHFHGGLVAPGNIILRQRGTQWHPSVGVGMGRDHTIYATREGRVVVHYDLAQQRRFVSVDDGTLEHFPSKAEMKRRLADSIDVPHYMSLTKKEQYDYVMSKVKEITDADRIKQKAIADQQLTMGGRRKMDLIDLTLM